MPCVGDSTCRKPSGTRTQPLYARLECALERLEGVDGVQRCVDHHAGEPAGEQSHVDGQRVAAAVLALPFLALTATAPQ